MKQRWYIFFLEARTFHYELNVSVLNSPLSSDCIDSILALFNCNSSAEPSMSLTDILHITNETEKEKYTQIAALYQK